ncbi:conserved Plasmodium protein, unknown function [Plasmodium chabaudi adami]|uniref:Chorein N-terminal domain-containing protein n=1 Tax=Plasmodium chabaudi adami TaxID=5826 RepID=A0A1D3LMN4_PLACE|nr:conserved Plasmodium protein, unknown function [Plasmodium chabaudi adami]
MLESLVEKLLNKFLAPYVEGIEKNLHLGVWSGNIVLENLNLKPQITEILDLSFKIVHGSIGQINIQIPWSSLGKNPVCVFIKNAHIYVKPRHYKKSESVIIEELRRAKMHRLEMLEEEISLIKQQKNKEKPAEKSTLIFKLLNKIINNIQIDIQDVFIHFEDIERNFFIGFILKSSSVKNLKKKDERSSEGNNDSESKKLNHIIEFKGLCIYSNSSVNNKKRGSKKSKKKGKKENVMKKKNSKDITHETNMVNNNLTNDCSKKEICSDTESKINDNNSKEENASSTSPMSIDDKKSSKQYSNDNIDSKFKFSSENFDNDEENDYLRKTLANINLFYKSDEHKLLDHNNFEYLIKPFDLVLPVEQSSNKKELKARLEISDKWEGITLTRTQITKIIEIMSEANNSRNEINKLLLKHASTVKLDVESLRNETKNEFINLYNKILGEEYNISKIELTKKEQNRLQILYDVVGVRHLAKWRLQCRDTLEKIIEEKNCKKKILYDSIYKQQSWWSWVTGNKKDIENKVQSILKTEQDFINEHELNILQEAVVNEDNYDVVIPTKYDFEFKLSNFSINIYDDRKKRKYIINKGINSKNDDKFNEQEQECIKEASNKNNEKYNETTNKSSDHNNTSNNLSSELCLSGTSESSLSTSSNISSPNSIYRNTNKLDYNEINILSINFYQIYSSLSLQSVVDHNDNDNFQWKFIIELQNFVAKHKNQIFMEFRNTKNAFSYSMDNSENIYQNPIYHSLLYSQSLCAYLEINHLVTEKGNTLSTLLRLNPLELYLSPLLINNILSFTFPLMDIINNKDITSTRRHKDKPESTQLDKGEAGKAEETTEINEVVEDTENEEDNEEALLHIKKMEQSELIEGLKEKGENVYNRAVQHLPELFEFYIHICGPILYFDNLTNGIVNLHLGNLIAKTEYPCAYNKFNLIFEFNETQITCLKTSTFSHNKLEWHRRKHKDSIKNTYSCTEGSVPEIKGLNDSRVFDRDSVNINSGEKEDDGLEKNFCNNIKDKYIEDEKFYILQPIPVKVYVEYDLKILKTNIILDGIFFQINPDAVSIILAVPTSITRYLTRFYSKNKKEDESLKNKRKGNAEKKDIDDKEDENVETNPQNECENDKIKNDDLSTNLMDDNIKKEETGLEVSNIDKNNRIEEESFLYDIDFLIKTSSFSIKNSKNCDILKYEACGISYKNYFQRKKKIIKVEIEQLWICDPSNKQPIFFTLAKNINSKDAYPFKYVSEYLKEEKYNSLNNMNTNDMAKISNSSKMLNESNFGTNEKYEHDDNNNTGCLERFQSAQRLEEFMLSNSKLNENVESNSNEMNDNNKNENGSKNSYPSLYKEMADVDKFDLVNNEVENFDSYENDKYINKEIKKQSSGKVEDNDDDDFMDAIEEKQLSINLQIMHKHNENNIAQIHVDFIVSDIELHWKYKTIKQIFKTMKEYKNILQYGIEKDMKYIKNKLKNEKELKNYKMFISEHTLRSVQATLKNVKDSLNILDIKASTETGDNQNNINENETAEKNETINQGSLEKDQQFEGFSDENNKILRDGDVFNEYNNKEKHNVENENSDVILKNGLNGTLPKLFGEENSYVKYFFNCYVKSASLSFWEKKKIFSKIQVSNIFYENNIYLNFDQKMFINIEKGIISLNGKNIISNNINDYTYDLFISKKRKEYIDGSEYIENNINNVESSNQNILNENSKDNRDYSDDEDKTLTDRKNSKDIFNYITVANLSDEIKKRKETMTPNKKKQFLFVGNVNVYNDKRYYNTCMMCDISGIYYIFYLRDLRLFLEYLDDGILNVFISKSYKKVVQVAQEKYFLFQFTIVDPIVIIPEDKNIIYNYKGQVKDTSKYDKDTKNSENNNTNLNNENNDKQGSTNKCIPYIESYLKFHLSTLKFKNAYTKNCAEEIVLRQRNEIKQKRMRKEKRRTKHKLKKKKVIKKYMSDQKLTNKGDNENDGDALSNGEGRNSTDSKHKKNKHVKIKEDKENYDLILGSKGLNNEIDNNQGNNNINMFDSNKKYDFTLYVDLLDIESRACENGGSKNIEGNILHKIDIGLCLLSRKDGIFIFFNGKDLCLDLTVYQLRFLLDIINENFCYKGYFPMCFICDKNIDIDNMLDAELFRKGNIALNNLKNKDVSINNNHIKNDEEIDDKKHHMPNKNDKMPEDNTTHGLNDTSGNNSNFNTEENDNNEMKNNNSIIKDTNKTDGIRKNGTKFYAYINLESLKIKTSFDNNIPVAIITFQNISISFDLTLLDFYYIYFFNLYSTSLYIDDVRNGSVNYYKRVAYCCIENEMNKKRGNRNSKYGGNVRFCENESDFVSPTSGASRDQNNHDNSNNNKINSSYTCAIESGGSVNDQGNRITSNDANQNFDERYEINNYKSLLNYMFDNNVFLNERKKNIKQKGIKIKINSFIEDLLLSIELDDAYICCFFVIFIDIYKFLSTGFNLSTLHLYPKPSPYIVSNKYYNNKNNSINNNINDGMEKQKPENEEKSKSSQLPEKKKRPKNEKKADTNASKILNKENYIKELLKDDKNQKITNINELLKMDNKPIHIDFKVNNGNFILFTNLENVDHPIIMWSNNFVFSFSLSNGCILFRKIYAIDSKIKRLNYVNNSIRLSRSMISNYSRVFNNNNKMDSINVSNPLHNYHKKKILLCENLNVIGEAIYESVDTKKDNYIIKKNIRKKDHPQFISVFEIDLNISNFDIRLSNDDVEILLKASSTLFGDVPSAYTDITIGAVIPPVTFIHRKIKSIFMRNNLFFISKGMEGNHDTINGLEITNLNRIRKIDKIGKKQRDRIRNNSIVSGNEKNELKVKGDIIEDREHFDHIKNLSNVKDKRELILSESSYNNNMAEKSAYNGEYDSSADSNSADSNLWYFESNNTDALCSKISTQENELELDTNAAKANAYKDVKINIKLNNVKCTFINDVKNAIVPIIRMTFSMDIKLRFYTDECSYIMNCINSNIEYFNNCIGEWEPFLEKCNISLDVHKVLPSDIYSEDIESIRTPISIIKINSAKALWFNITPQLVNLLFMFVPVFWEKVLNGLKSKREANSINQEQMQEQQNESIMENNEIEASKKGNDDKSTYDQDSERLLYNQDDKNSVSMSIPTSTNADNISVMSIKREDKKSKSIYEDSSSIFDVIPDGADENKSMDFHLDSFLKKEENGEAIDPIEDNSIIYYVNLTSDYYYAFTMPERNSDDMKDKRGGTTMIRSGNEMNTQQDTVRSDNNKKRESLDTNKGKHRDSYDKMSVDFANGEKGRVKYRYYTSIENEDIDITRYLPDVYTKIITTNELIPLDELLVNEIGNNTLIEKKDLYLYLIPIPPTNIVDTLYEMFVNISKRDIVLDLMITQNPKKTIENLLYYNNLRNNSANNILIENRSKLNEGLDFKDYKIKGAYYTDNSSIISGEKKNKDDISTTSDKLNKGNKSVSYLDDTASNVPTYEKDETDLTKGESHSSCLGDDSSLKEKNDKCTEEGDENSESGNLYSDSELYEEEYYSEISNDDEDSEWDSVDEYDGYDNNTTFNIIEKVNKNNSIYYYFNKKNINNIKRKLYSNSVFPANKFAGPFLKNSECVMINLIKNSCTSLNTALKNNNVIHVIHPSDYIFNEIGPTNDSFGNINNSNNISSKKMKYNEKNIMENTKKDNNKYEAILNREDINQETKLEQLNEEMNKQTNLVYKYRQKNNCLPQKSMFETICEIISPMPNYKILFMSSTVRIINKCGIPLEFSFFDTSKSPILLTSLKNRTIDSSILYPNHSDSFKNYKVSNSLNINPNIKIIQKNTNLSYTVILNHEYLLSPPECAFNGQSQLYLSFKPVNLVSDENNYYYISNGANIQDISNSMGKYNIGDTNENAKRNSCTASNGGSNNDKDLSLSNFEKWGNELFDCSYINIDNGWSDIFSSDISQGTYVKKCKVVDNRSMNERTGVATSSISSGSSNNSYLYFLVKIEHKISALPAEKNIRIITIYPHVSIVNTIPALVDIVMMSEATEETQNNFINEEKIRIEMLKNKKVKLLRQSKEISSYLNKINHVKQNNSINSNTSKALEAKRMSNNERVYVHEYNRLEKEIGNIDHEIKVLKKDLAARALNNGYVNKRLNPFSIFYIYEIKKYTCLNLKMKIGNSQCEWSDRIHLDEDDDETMTRLTLNFKKFASIEVEIIKNFNGYFNSLNSILGNKHLYIFSLPRCFIDRTGLGIKAINSNKYYPVINGITLLGDNSQIDLLLPHKTYNNNIDGVNNGKKKTQRDNFDDIFNDFNYPVPCDNSLILFKANLPPIGSYTEANVVCNNFYYTFCLNTEKIKTTNIPYIISRIITVVPQFIISNKLHYPLLIKQFQLDQIQGVRENDTSPLYFTKKHNVLLFQFKTFEMGKHNISKNSIESNTHSSNRTGSCDNNKNEMNIMNKSRRYSKNMFWSSVIFPSENFVGSNYMVLNNGGEKDESDVYVITCIPNMGTKNIIIEKLEKKINKGYIAYNNSSLVKYLKIRTFHDDAHNLKMGKNGSNDGTNKQLDKNLLLNHFLKASDMEHYFNVEYNKYSYLGWVNPFIYISRNIQIEIVLHDMNVIPRSPLVLKFASFNYSQKTYHINYFNITFIISIEYIEDLISIKLTHRINSPNGPCDINEMNNMGKHLKKNSIGIEINGDKNVLAVSGSNYIVDGKDKDENDEKKYSTNSSEMKSYNKIESIDKYEIMNDNIGTRGMANAARNSQISRDVPSSYNKNRYIEKKVIEQNEYNYVMNISERGRSRYSGEHNNSIYSNRKESIKVINNTYKNVHVILNLTQIGASIISNILKEEVFFIELSKLCALFYMKNEEEVIDIKITDVQVDCQLESCKKCVLLANRGLNLDSSSGMNNNGIISNSGRGDRGGLYKLRNGSTTYNDENERDEAYDEDGNRYGSNNDVFSKNINNNDEKTFLNVYVERLFISHNDVIFKKIQVLLDDIEIEMDSETLNGINLLVAEYIEGINIIQKKNLLYEEIQKWTVLPVYVNYKSPDIPLAINIQYMQINKFTLIVWCSFLLDKMHMLSDLLRIGLRILMVSGKLELLGAPVTLNQEIFNDIRVSIKSFYALLKDKYSHSILACLGFIVGYSSLINIPKIPLEIGRNTIGLAVYAVDNVSVGIGSLLSNLTFDTEYINRRQKERNFKTNTNMKEGLLSAVKNIGEGVLSLSNIVTKPIEGAQKEGVGGFFKGIGKGVAGSLVKPLDKVGQAVSDVTRGIKAEVSKPIGGYKYKTKRHRKPRMLWGEYGKIKEYNTQEAELRECLGLRFSENIMKCLTIHKQQNDPPSHYALLLYPKVIIYANLYANIYPNSFSNSKNNNDFTSDKKGDIVIWSVKIDEISEIRASSHGLIIRTTNGTVNSVYKIPCNNASLINKIYRELHNSKNSIKSTIILGDSISSMRSPL